jgi:predicted AlkP superfamily phosphohydrolase/phosphomutase
MKILVIGLDCATPEILFGDEFNNLRTLMEAGCYGSLESIVPPITVPAWMCMATGQDPGSLGVYGFRNRRDHRYGGFEIVNSRAIRELAIWDQVAREGGRASIVGVPPNYPPRKVSGISIGCFLTPDPAKNEYTFPAAVKGQIADLVGEYPVDVHGFRTENKAWLRDQIYGMSRRHFRLVRHLLKNSPWDYFQFVEIGLDRLQHGFWKYHDPQHRRHEPDSPFQDVIRDYYRYLDEEIGEILGCLDDETAVLVLSDHGAKRLDGGFCINQWLMDQNYLALHHHPQESTPFAQLDVDWARTAAWSEGGYYARVFLNVKGREPDGVIDPADYEKFRDELKAKLEATVDQDGQPLGTAVYKPEEIYREVRNVAPDLIVHFGDLHWRSIGGVGYPSIHVEENDTGPDDCNHAQHGAFILAAPRLPLEGPAENVHLLHLAPMLLELAGYDVPDSMIAGAPAVAIDPVGPVGAAVSETEEEILRQRLSGLGYI